MKCNFFFVFESLLFSILISSVLIAQEIKQDVSKAIEYKTTIVKETESTQAVNDKISFKDGTTTLLEINSEGVAGSIVLPNVGSSLTGNKLYNNGTHLFWGASQLDGSGSVISLNDLTDAIFIGNSLFLGYGSGVNDDGTENQNTAIGRNALLSNTSGYYNIAVGYNSLYQNTSGYDNTASGYYSLFSNVTGIGNTAYGFQSLAANTANYNIAYGYNSLNTNTTGSNNSGIGFLALANNTIGNNNTAFGYYTLNSNVAGSNGVAVGYESQKYANNTSTNYENNNTSVGYQSLMGSTTPASNTGFRNSAFGYQALYSNTTGVGNTANGYKILFSNTTGSFNTAIGERTIYSNMTGFQNTAVGEAALYSNTTGNNNTALGSYADVTSGNLTNATAIGYNAQVNASNKIRLGDIDVSVIEGNVDFTFTSDSTKKENFLKVEGEKVLEKFVNFKLTSWNYKIGNPITQRHYGIMAQDFFSAFGHDQMGTIGNDTTLTGSDVEGINMIAIQALEKRTKQQATIIIELQKQNTELEKRLNKIESLLEGQKFTQTSN